MRISTEDLVKMLKAMDDVEMKAAAAISSCDSEDLQVAAERMRDLRALLYSLLERAEEPPAAIVPPAVVPLPLWERWGVTCDSKTE